MYILALGYNRVADTRIILLPLAIMNSGQNRKHNCLSYWRQTKGRQKENGVDMILEIRGTTGKVSTFPAFFFRAIPSLGSLWGLECSQSRNPRAEKLQSQSAGLQGTCKQTEEILQRKQSWMWGDRHMWIQTAFRPSRVLSYTTGKKDCDILIGNQMCKGWKSHAEISTSAHTWRGRIWHSSTIPWTGPSEHLGFSMKTPEGHTLGVRITSQNKDQNWSKLIPTKPKTKAKCG